MRLQRGHFLTHLKTHVVAESFTVASPGSPPAGQGAEPGWESGGKAPEAEKQDINLVLRITLVNAHRPFYSSYNYHHVCKLSDFQEVATRVTFSL